MFFTNFFARFVLNGPGAILMIDTFFFEYFKLSDFNKLEKATLNEEDIIKFSFGSFIIDEDI